MRLLIVAMLCGCAPDVPSPRERADIADREDAHQLERQVLAIPGVRVARAAVHRAFREPLTGVESGSASAIFVSVAPSADRAAIERATHELAPAAHLAMVVAPDREKPATAKWFAIVGLALVVVGAFAVAIRARPKRSL